MESLNLNIFNILIISGVIHGFFFSSIILLSRKLYNSKYLALTVLFLSLSNLQYWIIDTNIFHNSDIHYYFIPWQWLILPAFYLHIEIFINKSIEKSKRFYLTLPFIIIFSIHLLQILYKFIVDESYTIPSHFKRGIFIYLEFLSFLFNISIIYLVYKKIIRYEHEVKFDSGEIISETRWIKHLVYIGTSICFCWLIALTVVVIFNLNKSYIFYPMWIGISILVYWMGYIGLGKSQLLEERIALRQQRKNDLKKKPEKTTSQNSEIFNKLRIEIENQKLYLNPELNLESLSKILEIKQSLISQSIKSNTNFNFNEYINSFRIHDIKFMLNNPEYSNYTIVAIGLEAGFNSKASFYRAFKKHTGLSPAEFKINKN